MTIALLLQAGHPPTRLMKMIMPDDDDDDDDDDDGDDVDDDDYNGSHFGDTCTSPADWTSTRWSATWNKCAFYAGSEPSSRASTGETICICICICIYICIYI